MLGSCSSSHDKTSTWMCHLNLDHANASSNIWRKIVTNVKSGLYIGWFIFFWRPHSSMEAWVDFLWLVNRHIGVQKHAVRPSWRWGVRLRKFSAVVIPLSVITAVSELVFYECMWLNVTSQWLLCSNSRPAANTGYFQWRRVASKLGIE